jgi:hypothetical protein
MYPYFWASRCTLTSGEKLTAPLLCEVAAKEKRQLTQRACKIYVALILAWGRVLIIHFAIAAHEYSNVMGERF